MSNNHSAFGTLLGLGIGVAIFNKLFSNRKKTLKRKVKKAMSSEDLLLHQDWVKKEASQWRL